MALISIILGLLLDRYWKEIDQWRKPGWFYQYSDITLKKSDPHLHNPTTRFLLILAIPVALLLFAQQTFASWSLVLSFIFSFVIFVYCLGSLEIEQQFDEIITALNEKDHEKAQALIEDLSSETVDSDNMVDQTLKSTMNILIEKLLGVIFWFAILGPIGAVLYRFSQWLNTHYATDPVMSIPAERMMSVLNWLPQRFLAISFAVTGHFEGALAAFKENRDTDRTQQFLLMDMCHGALEGNTIENMATYLSAFRGLILRSLVFWLTAIAILTLLGWH